MEAEKKWVSWTVFCWVVGIVSVILLGVYGLASSANSVSQENRLDIREIQTNYKNIDQTLQEIKSLMQKHLEK